MGRRTYSVPVYVEAADANEAHRIVLRVLGGVKAPLVGLGDGRLEL